MFTSLEHSTMLPTPKETSTTHLILAVFYPNRQLSNKEISHFNNISCIAQVSPSWTMPKICDLNVPRSAATGSLVAYYMEDKFNIKPFAEELAKLDTMYFALSPDKAQEVQLLLESDFATSDDFLATATAQGFTILERIYGHLDYTTLDQVAVTDMMNISNCTHMSISEFQTANGIVSDEHNTVPGESFLLEL